MTGSQRGLSACAIAIATLLLVLVGAASADHHGDPPVEMISAKIGGKNVFIPGTVVIKAGKPRTISIVNTTDTPHGFVIRGAGIEEVLQPQVEQQVEVPALEPGLYAIDCHLHPPHRSAQLLVVANPK
jgi:plastocyanin